MSTKELALKTIRELPENVDWEGIKERIFFISGVEKGLGELDEGRGVPLEKVMNEMKEWTSK
ncbi:MAG: hypothetical protein LAT55_10560 [Opitutales bacterium]|nr:hypothetical protein [Opitutales bacterium]